MDFREIKRITAYARKAGIKSLKFNGFEMELHESAIMSKSATKNQSETSNTNEIPLDNVTGEPSLDQINHYIYGMNEESQ